MAASRFATSITVVGWIASVDHVGDRAVVTHHIGVWDDDDLWVLSGIVHHHTSEVCNTGGGVGNSHGSKREEDIGLAVLVEACDCPIQHLHYLSGPVSYAHVD